MDRVLGWFLASCFFALASSWLALSLYYARRRAERAERLVDILVAKGVAANGAVEQTAVPALEAIANEVERIGEGQRFLTRTLLQRAGERDDGLRVGPRAVTPH